MHFQLENSPALALLHKRHASVLVSFFQKAFRDSNVPEVPEERLEGRWEVFIEKDVVLSDWEGETPTNTAKFYLEEWCRNRWLARRYSEKDGTYLYRLTAHTEQALLFVEQHLTASRRTFVGTESNFSKIWHSLTELAEKTQTDPNIREKQLLAERERIDAEIIELRQTGMPRKLDHTAVKSRLYDLVGMTNRFLADFRSVEESFRKQRDDIQNLYLEHLPNTLSCLMDEETFSQCHDEVGGENVKATLPSDFVASHLTSAERALWKKCAEDHVRLEQEHIPREAIIPALNRVATSGSNALPV